MALRKYHSIAAQGWTRTGNLKFEVHYVLISVPQYSRAILPIKHETVLIQ
jgi:hypothetical protein